MSADPGILFDVDGTLVDTNYLHAACWSEAMRQNDKYVPTASVHRAIGMGSDELLQHLLGDDLDDASAEAIRSGHLTLYREFWGRLRRLPGARDLLRTCAGRGLRIVLASSAAEDELNALRSTLDADEYIDEATSSSDADAAKPAPDIVQAALSQSGIDPDAAVFVGDSVWDGAAAQRSGVRFVAVTCGGTSEAELRDAGAVEVWRDPADLLDHLDASIVGEPGRRG
jgi:HAD superfamily hydrolase (TIGR01549 family)